MTLGAYYKDSNKSWRTVTEVTTCSDINLAITNIGSNLTSTQVIYQASQNG